MRHPVFKQNQGIRGELFFFDAVVLSRLHFFRKRRYMYYLKTSACFDSAHFLHGYNGKCANIHGHHWVVEVKISGGKLQENGEKRGMLLDFGDFKHTVKELAESFDHTLIYEKNTLKPATLSALEEEGFSLLETNFRPTAENFAAHIYAELCKKGLPVFSVTVNESPENCAVYGE